MHPPPCGPGAASSLEWTIRKSLLAVGKGTKLNLTGSILGACAAEGSAAATREKTVRSGITACAQGTTLGLSALPNRTRFLHVSHQSLLPRRLLVRLSQSAGETMRRIEKDGKFYRMRRGKLVERPVEWVGQVVYPQTVRERASSHTGKVAREAKYAGNRNYKDRAMEIGGELAVEELKRK
jgi:hypothetical protein